MQVSREPEIWVATQDAETARALAEPSDVRAAPARPRWRRAEFLAGRGLLRALLRAVAPEQAGRAILTQESGRPVLAGSARLAVSVSHDGDRVAAGVGRCARLGVDLQLPPAELSESLVRRCVRAPLPADPAERALEFAWIWSVQEACVKASGQGWAGAPWLIEVEPGATAGRWRHYHWQTLRQSDVPLSFAYGMSR
jgi:4'-phosphopantetheinyl transferase